MLAHWTYPAVQSAFIWASFRCSMKFFHLKRALGLALGELGPCLRNHRKTLVSSVYLCLFPWESFSRHTLFISMCGKTEQISLVRNEDAVRYRLNSDCCMTIRLRQLWEELLPWERTRWHWSKHVKFRPSWLFHKGCLSLHSCQTAILPHRGSPLRPFPRVLLWAEACWAWASNRSANLVAVRPPAVTKSLELLGWDPHPWAPPNKHKRFQYTVTSHIESCTGRGSEAKSLAFWNGRHMAKKGQIQ